VVGYGSAADAWDLIQPVEQGDGVRRAMLAALERHNVPADEVDLINPHGTSTPLGDLREAQAIKAVFGERASKIAISATKSLTGHLMGAAGAFEGVATVLSVHRQCAPATLNFRDEDPEIGLDVVRDESRSMEIRYAMSDNIGLGGHNGAVIFKRYDGD
jgi:3-oxoacyl-[acyl-carrier-protein] synthase II